MFVGCSFASEIKISLNKEGKFLIGETKRIFWEVLKNTPDEFTMGNFEGNYLIEDVIYLSEVLTNESSDTYSSGTAIMTLVGPINEKNTFLKFKEKNYQIHFEKIEFELKDIKDTNALIVIEESLTTNRNYYYLYVIFLNLLLFFFLVVPIWIKRRRRKLQLKEELEKTENKKRKYQKMFLDAESRQDIEKLYALRAEWRFFLEGETSEIEELFTSIEKIQYKKEWSNIEENNIKNIFNKLKEEFSKLI